MTVNLAGDWPLEGGGISLSILEQLIRDGDNRSDGYLRLCDWSAYGLPADFPNVTVLKALRARVYAIRGLLTPENKNEILNRGMSWGYSPEGHDFWRRVFNENYDLSLDADLRPPRALTPDEINTVNTNTRMHVRALAGLHAPVPKVKPLIIEMPGCCAGTVVNRIGFDDPDGINPGMTWDDLSSFHANDVPVLGRSFQLMILHDDQLAALRADGRNIGDLGYQLLKSGLKTRSGGPHLNLFIRETP